jgi:aminopeptidase-like protein
MIKRLVEDLYPLNRSIVSEDFDRALEYIGREIPLTVHRVPSGTECWSWIVPRRWAVRAAWIEAEGRRLVDLADHPLHVVTGSLPIDAEVSRDELMRHLVWDTRRPQAIPYRDRYYELDWGFCVAASTLPAFRAERYRVFIDASYADGHLSVGETLVEGKERHGGVLLAHVDHPAQAEDGLSSAAVLVEVGRRLLARRPTRYTYRLLFVPETIGSIAYLSQNESVIADIRWSMFLEMLGNTRHPLTLQRSYGGDSAIDRMATYALKRSGRPFTTGPFGHVVQNDEKVWNAPGVDVPSVSLSRAGGMRVGEDGRPEFAPYPEYHTSDDTPAIVSEERLEEAVRVIEAVIDIHENDFVPERRVKGPFFLSRYGLWVDWRENLPLNLAVDELMYLLDGRHSAFDIADRLDLDMDLVCRYLEKFREAGLIDIVR